MVMRSGNLIDGTPKRVVVTKVGFLRLLADIKRLDNQQKYINRY
jgi:hypothetical protein